MNLRLKMWIQLTLTAIVSIYLLIDCAHCMHGDDDSDEEDREMTRFIESGPVFPPSGVSTRFTPQGITSRFAGEASSSRFAGEASSSRFSGEASSSRFAGGASSSRTQEPPLPPSIDPPVQTQPQPEEEFPGLFQGQNTPLLEAMIQTQLQQGIPSEFIDTSGPVETIKAEGPTEGGIQMLSKEQLAEEQEMSNKRFLEMLEKYKPQRDLDPNDIDTVRDPDWPSCDQKLIMDLATAGDLLYLFDDDKQDDARQLLDNTVQPYLTHCIKLVRKDIEDKFYDKPGYYVKEKSDEWIDLAYSYARENELNEVLLKNFEQYSRLMDPEQSEQLDQTLKATLQDNTELNFANKLTAYQTGREGTCQPTVPDGQGKDYEIANGILVLIITKFPDVPIVKQIILEHQDEFLEKSIHFWVLCRNLRKKKLPPLLPEDDEERDKGKKKKGDEDDVDDDGGSQDKRMKQTVIE